MVSFDSRAVRIFFLSFLFPLLLALCGYPKANNRSSLFLSCVAEKEKEGKRESCSGKMHLHTVVLYSDILGCIKKCSKSCVVSEVLVAALI